MILPIIGFFYRIVFHLIIVYGSQLFCIRDFTIFLNRQFFFWLHGNVIMHIFINIHISSINLFFLKSHFLHWSLGLSCELHLQHQLFQLKMTFFALELVICCNCAMIFYFHFFLDLLIITRPKSVVVDLFNSSRIMLSCLCRFS